MEKLNNDFQSGPHNLKGKYTLHELWFCQSVCVRHRPISLCAIVKHTKKL